MREDTETANLYCTRPLLGAPHDAARPRVAVECFWCAFPRTPTATPPYVLRPVEPPTQLSRRSTRRAMSPDYGLCRTLLKLFPLSKGFNPVFYERIERP